MRLPLLPKASLPIAAALALVAVAGCGGGGSSHTTTTVKTASATSASSSDGALAMQQRMTQVIARVSPAVVQIETSQGLGSGIVYDDHGDIVTNAHVVGSARTFRVTTSDGKRSSASLVGTFPPDDLAVIRSQGLNAPAASFGNSSRLRVGDVVLAIGNPLGLRSSVTDGIVSALGRDVSEPGGAVLPHVVQTSAPINPGNSGGALVGLDGKVVGIPTLAATDPELGGTAPGIGFAIPSDVVSDVAGQLVAHGRVTNSHRAYLGVQVGIVPGTAGVVVGAVQKGGPAAAAGIRPGDEIVSLAGHPTSSPADLTSALAALPPGRTVAVRVRRDGSETTLHVKLGTYPGRAP